MVEQLKKQLSNPDSVVSLFLGLAVVIVVGIMIVNYVRGRGGETAQQAQITAEAESTSSGNSDAYTVKQGDTLWSIAEATIGSGYNWVDIAQANAITDPNSIETGQKLTVPKVAKRDPGVISQSASSVKRPADGKYTVKKGDSLWTISLEFYGTGYRWADIAKANQLVNPDLIFNGNVLVLPE